MTERLGVIFDVDGVLVDSYDAHFRSWQKLFEGLKWRQMSEEQFAQTFGRTSREILAELYPEQQLSQSRIDELDHQKEEHYRQFVAKDFPTMAGATQLIDALHEAGFLLAAGSSGPPENTELALERIGKRKLFRAVVTGRDVQRGKPDPQIFLTAAERLQLPPSHCAVVEDAPAGIAAARAAGMVAIGFPSTGRSAEQLVGCHHLVKRLNELTPEFVRNLILVQLGIT